MMRNCSIVWIDYAIAPKRSSLKNQFQDSSHFLKNVAEGIRITPEWTLVVFYRFLFY